MENCLSGIVLKELNRITRANGFYVAGAASFVGQHSFSSELIQVSKGRPNADDLQKAKLFGNDMKQKIAKVQQAADLPELSISGKRPLMAKILPLNSSRMFAHIPEVNLDFCTHCGICIVKCPFGAIDADTLAIDKEKCLRCFACVKVCKPQARKIKYKKKPLVVRFLTNVNRCQKEPVLYV